MHSQFLTKGQRGMQDVKTVEAIRQDLRELLCCTDPQDVFKPKRLLFSTDCIVVINQQTALKSSLHHE